MSKPVNSWKPQLQEFIKALRDIAPADGIAVHGLTWIGIHDIPEATEDQVFRLLGGFGL